MECLRRAWGFAYCSACALCGWVPGTQLQPAHVQVCKLRQLCGQWASVQLFGMVALWQLLGLAFHLSRSGGVCLQARCALTSSHTNHTRPPIRPHTRSASCN